MKHLRTAGFTVLLLAAACALVAAPAGRRPSLSTAAAQGEGEVTLTLLHNNDGESSLLPLTNNVEVEGASIELPVAGIAAYKAVTEREIGEARASGNAVLNVYAGDAYLPGSTFVCSQLEGNPLFDAVAQGAIPYDAHIIGNHEFDSNPDFFERFIRALAAQPFLSANLDFSAEPGFDDLVDADGLIELPVEDGRVVGRSMVVTDGPTGARFGLVGATTPSLSVISAPRNVAVTPDFETTAAVVQTEIDRLQELGVNRIIFVSHLQNLSNDTELIGLLRGVDIAVAGGGDELLQNPAVDAARQRLPGERAEVAGEYPMQTTDADGRTVYVVTTAGNYKYVGRLDAVFNGAGEVSRVVAETSYPRPVVPSSEAAAAARFPGAIEKDAGLVEAIEAPLNDCLADLATTPVATTEVLLDVSRSAVRSRESNAGNLLADAFIHSYDQNAAALGLPERASDHPVVALLNGGGIRQNAGDVLPASGSAPGEIFLVNTLDVLPFANAVAIVPDVSPTDLKAAFELSVSRHPDTSGGFLQISGIAVVYDPTRPVDARVVSLTLDDGTAIVAAGAVVKDAPAVTVITVSFLADGGDGYAMFEPYSGKLQLPTSYEQAFRSYLQSLGTISADDVRYAPGGEGRSTFLQPSALPEEEDAPEAPSTGSGLVPEGGSPSLLVLLLALGAAVGAGALWRIPGNRRS